MQTRKQRVQKLPADTEGCTRGFRSPSPSHMIKTLMYVEHDRSVCRSEGVFRLGIEHTHTHWLSHTYTHARTHARTLTNTRTHTYTRARTHARTHPHSRTHAYTRAQVRDRDRDRSRTIAGVVIHDRFFLLAMLFISLNWIPNLGVVSLSFGKESCILRSHK